MRRTHTLMLAMVALVGASAVQAQGSSAPMERGMAMGRGHGGLMRGIHLSDVEKAKVKEIHARYATERRGLHEGMRKERDEFRTARQKGDTAALRALRDRTAPDREKARATMERERAEIRGALAPENQKQFDANVQRLAQRRDEWEKEGGREGRMRGHGHRKGHRPGRD